MAFEAADLTVEDGTGLEDANTYASLETASGYHASVGHDAWETYAEDAQALALVQATQHVDLRWRFVGRRYVDGQALAWPRDPAQDADGFDQSQIVPVVIEWATSEYALRILELGREIMRPSDENGSAAISSWSESAGPASRSVTYANPVRLDLGSYAPADRMLILSGLVRGRGLGTIRA